MLATVTVHIGQEGDSHDEEGDSLNRNKKVTIKL